MRQRLRFTVFLACGLGLLASSAETWAASPSLSVILPRGLQRGTTSVLTFNGGQLADAKEILFFSPGFEVTKLEPSAGAVKATIKVAKDCRRSRTYGFAMSWIVWGNTQSFAWRLKTAGRSRRF